MNRKYLDLAERVGFTALQAFAAEWLVSSTLDQRSFKIAGVAAAISAAKCIVGFQVGNRDTASMAPAV